MPTKKSDPASHNAQLLSESRDGVRSLQFFIAAMAAQAKDMEAKLGQVEPVVVGGDVPEHVAKLEAERDAAREEVETLRARVAQLEQEMARQHVAFADHHAAKQEIARLKSELEAARGETATEQEEDGQRKRWLGR
jgi:predicted RNase H-like nuclease (RuvC/YqgF family)